MLLSLIAQLLLVILSALILDILLGEPKKFHPLIGFGWLADKIEKNLNVKSASESRNRRKAKGLFAVCIAILPFFLLAVSLNELAKDNRVMYLIFASVTLYLAIGWRSLIEHASQVSEPLRRKDLDNARKSVAMIVSRDTQALSESDIAKAATESVLENGADAIFAVIFWFCVLGVPGVVLYRLTNTLDAMWGYKNKRYEDFGFTAAKLDDCLNFIPARLTALSYSLAGNTRMAMNCWKRQGFNWKSPNAGPVMAAGAGAINVSLGGDAIYGKTLETRQALGPEIEKGGMRPTAESIEKACALVQKALIGWLGCIFLIAIILVFITFVVGII